MVDPPAPGDAGRGLEEQGRLADAGLAADEGDRARDEAAGEHPVELADAGGRGAGVVGRRPRRCDGPRDRAAGDHGGGGASRSSTRVFHCVAARAPAGPHGLDAPHSVQRWTVRGRRAGLAWYWSLVVGTRPLSRGGCQELPGPLRRRTGATPDDADRDEQHQGEPGGGGHAEPDEAVRCGGWSTSPRSSSVSRSSTDGRQTAPFDAWVVAFDVDVAREADRDLEPQQLVDGAADRGPR